MALGDHVRLFGHYVPDRTFVTCYARAISTLPLPSPAPMSCTLTEEEHLLQLAALHQLCDTEHSSQDPRLHNFKLSLTLQ